MANVTNVSAVPRPELVSIIIPCVGMIEYTKLCVPSVLRFTREPFELIFIDIGSLDGTTEYLTGLHAGLEGRVRIELDKWSDLGLFDTDILSAKARQAGFNLAICRDLFIHHFGTRTFAHTAPVRAEAAQR